MGTWEIVAILHNCTPLPGTWACRIKTDDQGLECQLKSQWCARCDLQQQWEYNLTYSPTSKMAAVCMLIATSAHEALKLFQWDVQGAFCTSDVDTEIYMQVPTGYPLPP
eukprot:2710877-Rhodomonas_salina.1